MSRRYLIPAADVIEIRSALRLTQSALAERLGVTRRTVIRGEQRGLEIPSTYGDSPRKAVAEAWRELKADAAGALALRAKDAELAKRRAQNRAAAKRYRRRRRVTHPPRSRVTKKATGRGRRDTSRASSSRQKSRAKIRKSDKSRAIAAKKSPRPAGRRRGRK
jgi:transcriptional regulator with XRE-family HTH domain